MKRKYTLTIADMQLNVVADMEPEQVEKIAGMLDRKMREFHLSSRHCTKNEAALLCALDFCADRLELQSRTGILQAENSRYQGTVQELETANRSLTQEVETLRSENTLLRSLIGSANTADAPAAPKTPVAEAPAAAPVSASAFFSEVGASAETSAVKKNPFAKPSDAQATTGTGKGDPADADSKRKGRRGSMFDLLSFDDQD